MVPIDKEAALMPFEDEAEGDGGACPYCGAPPGCQDPHWSPAEEDERWWEAEGFCPTCGALLGQDGKVYGP